MTRLDAILTASDCVDSGRFSRHLADLVSFETESQNPDQEAELGRYLNEGLAPRFLDLGFTCEIYANPVASAGPILVAERIEDTALPTILSYGHGDVIRAQTGQWRDGLHPFRLLEDRNSNGVSAAENMG